MAKSITPKKASRTETRRAVKAGMSQSMVAVAAVTGRTEDRKAARPAALQDVRKLLLGHFSNNTEKFNEGVVVFRAVTGTEGAEWDAAVYAACRAANSGASGAIELEGFLRDPVGALDRGLLEQIALLEQIPEMYRTAKTDPHKAREKREKLLSKDWTKVRHACTSVAEVMESDFTRAREYLARQQAPVAEPVQVTETAEPAKTAKPAKTKSKRVKA